MPLTFEWNLRKARTNLGKHGIGFEEAATIFGDRSSLTIPDPEHSAVEQHYITMARLTVNCSLSFTPSAAIISGSSVHDVPIGVSADFMRKAAKTNARESMRNDYDFSHGVRGKYARRYAEGANVVVLEPDVAKAFPNSKAVNRSLRKIIRARQILH